MSRNKVSVRGAVRDALRAERRAIKGTEQPLLKRATFDSFVNFSQKLGVGADNPLTSGTYGFNPITRNRQLLEWIHRGSWLGGMAVDIPAEDMTRSGIDFLCEMDPDDSEDIERAAVTMNIWPTIAEVIKWGRLYGGCIGVALIDGQDPKTPLRLETVGRDQFKGLVALDRWTVDPSLSDLVTEYGPHLGTPQYYEVLAHSPTLRGQVIHHSRVFFRHLGVELPYQQRLTENLWGISVLERLYDRMVAFDSATTGAAQIVFKSYLRTLKIENLRDIVAAGGAPLNGLMQYTELMRRFQGVEGLTLLDKNDEFEVQQTSAFSGISDVLLQLGQQLSGALQTPLTRLFGQSPAGLSATGESDMRNYYDGIKQKQNKDLLVGATNTYRLIAQSEGKRLPDNFMIEFRNLWQMTSEEKAGVAKSTGEAVGAALENGIIGRKTALLELRQSSRVTGVFTNITDEAINEADDEVMPPDGELAMQQEHEEGLQQSDHEHDLKKTKLTHQQELQKTKMQQEHQAKMAKEAAKNARPQAKAGAPANGARRRVKLQ